MSTFFAIVLAGGTANEPLEDLSFGGFKLGNEKLASASLYEDYAVDLSPLRRVGIQI
ncbi:MAG: hypothetical protein IIC58_04305 [Proteobacteria bacterium]|nr:hypothetical protein [Pseudomonadota bacterium]